MQNGSPLIQRVGLEPFDQGSERRRNGALVRLHRMGSAVTFDGDVVLEPVCTPRAQRFWEVEKFGGFHELFQREGLRLGHLIRVENFSDSHSGETTAACEFDSHRIERFRALRNDSNLEKRLQRREPSGRLTAGRRNNSRVARSTSGWATLLLQPPVRLQVVRARCPLLSRL